MNWKNKITTSLAIDYPIVQAPMFGVGTPAMAAAASNIGGLGSLPLGDLAGDQCIALLRETKKLTDKPFAANIFVNDIPPLTEKLLHQYQESRSFIEELAHKNGLDLSLPDLEEFQLTDYRDQVDALISEGCSAISFIFGNLDKESIEKCKEHGVLLIGTCTSVQEALELERSGIDLICVQGYEAGGHRGSFHQENIPAIGGLSLLPQVYDAVSVPLIYAGGIYNAKTVHATKLLGAAGFQIGSMLLCAKESSLLDFEKQALKNAGEDQIVLTKSFSGRYARGLSNTFIKALDHSKYVLPYPYQNKLTGALRKLAKKKQNINFLSVWAGSSLSSFSDAGTAEILLNLIKEVEQTAEKQNF